MQHITLELSALPEHRNTLLSLLVELFPETRKSQGCISINAYTDEHDTNRIIFMEEWETATDYEAYLNGRIDSGVFDKLKTMLASEPKITYWNQTAA